MRNRVMTLAAALLLASSAMVMAQEAPAGGANAPSNGIVDVGFRATSTTGDEARYERYRDTRNGLYTNIVFGKETEKYLFSFEAQNVGYHDQRYAADYQNSKVKFSFLWDSIPLNYCYNCLTPWVESQANVWTLDTAARTAVQNKVPGVVGIPTTAAALNTPSIYRGIAKPFEMQQRRDTAGVNVTYAINEDLGFDVAFMSTAKTGYQPFGMAFAFSDANELPMQLDNRTNDFTAAIEWVKPRGMFRAAFDYSVFTNQFNQLEWDNPIRITDFSNGLVPPAGPYDPSGYSNGNGPARGRISSFPDNTMATVSFMGLYKIAKGTSVNGTVQVYNMDQNDDLIPWTTNSVINQPLVWATFPELAHLERGTAEAEVRAVNALVNFQSRFSKMASFNAKYRHNTHANFTNPFNAVEYVRFDAVPEETGGETHGQSVVRDTFDATLSLNLLPRNTLRIGYGYDNFNRTGRAHNDMRDQAFRVTWDAVGTQWMSLRAGYEYVDRTGYGFSVHHVEEGGGQPGLRFYDEADRTRNRFNLLVTLTPTDQIDVTGSVSYLKDEYGGPGMEFGLFENGNTAYNVGINYALNSTVNFGANYGRDDFSTYQKSRNANPAPDPSWTNPLRDWTVDNDELVNNFDVYLDLLQAFAKTDIRIGYNYSDSDNAIVLGGPRVDPAVPGSLAATRDAAGNITFEQLPTVTNSWHRLTADVMIRATQKIGVAFGLWYEKFDVSDFATINLPGSDQPRIDYLGGLTTGYGNRPYKGTTGTFRILYYF